MRTEMGVWEEEEKVVLEEGVALQPRFIKPLLFR